MCQRSAVFAALNEGGAVRLASADDAAGMCFALRHIDGERTVDAADYSRTIQIADNTVLVEARSQCAADAEVLYCAAIHIAEQAVVLVGGFVLEVRDGVSLAVEDASVLYAVVADGSKPVAGSCGTCQVDVSRKYCIGTWLAVIHQVGESHEVCGTANLVVGDAVNLCGGQLLCPRLHSPHAQQGSKE